MFYSRIRLRRSSIRYREVSRSLCQSNSQWPLSSFIYVDGLVNGTIAI